MKIRPLYGKKFIQSTYWGFNDAGKVELRRATYRDASPEELNDSKWVWVCDGYPHKSDAKEGGEYPSVIIPTTMHLHGTEEDASAIGYRKVVCVMDELLAIFDEPMPSWVW